MTVSFAWFVGTVLACPVLGNNQKQFQTRFVNAAGYFLRMAKMKKKSDLETKDCATCGRPFAWRKKWAKVWDEVRYCSDACRRNRNSR
jgi:hypothetical protein